MLQTIGAMLAGAFVGGLMVHALWRAYFDAYRKQKALNRQRIEQLQAMRGRP